MSKFSVGSSKGTIDLRKRKPGRQTHTLSFNWGRRLQRASSGRSSPLRTRRRRTRALIVLGVLLLIGSIGYGVSFVSYLPQFSITTLTVEGSKELPSGLVKTYLESKLFDGFHSFLSRRNMFLYPRAELEKDVMKYFPRVQSAKISRKAFFGQEVTVTIEEREAFAKWCLPAQAGQDNDCYLLDASGFIFASDVNPSAPVATPYVFTGAMGDPGSPIGERFLTDTFSEVAALLKQLEETHFSPLKISVDSARDFSISLAQGFDLRASFGEALEDTVRNLELVLSSETLRGKENDLEYVDLRFGNRVYYKLKGEAATESSAE